MNINDEPPPQNANGPLSTPGAAASQANDAKEAEAWKVGDVILDLYEVTGILGEGGMGRVYRVHHRGWNTDLAIKSPKPEIFNKAGGKQDFTRECETWVNLGLHPHIVSCYYVRTLGGIPRVFAEYVAGGSLKEWIDRRKLYAGGPEVALERILDAAIQFAWGLEYAHQQGVVHQDVKPANVMMGLDGVVKITDFGLARARAMAGEAAGAGLSILVSSGGMTPAYCSPEQGSRQPLSTKTDMWSWGVSILEMFVGEVTWFAGQAAEEALANYLENEPVDPSIPRMPAALAGLLRRCFKRRPDDRPARMVEIAHLLQQIYLHAVGKAYARPAPQTSALQAGSLNNKALSFYDLGRAPEAENVWQSNLKVTPGHLDTTYNYGLVQWRSGKKDDAALLRDLQTAAVSVDPWRVDWLMSQVHLESGDVAQALEKFGALPKEAASRTEVAAVYRQARELEHTGRRLHRTMIGHTGGVTAVCFSQDCRYALSGSKDGTMKLWEVATGLSLRTFAGHLAEVSSATLSRDGRFALSGSRDGTLKFWEVETGRCMVTFEGHPGGVSSVCLSADGCLALSGGWDKSLKLWEVTTGRCLRTFVGHTGKEIRSVDLSEDGRYALSGSDDWSLKLWEVATGECVRTFEGHTGYVASGSLSKDGLYVLSGADKTLKLWETATGQCIRTFEGHTSYVISGYLSTDGCYALSGSWDGSMKLWEVTTGHCLRTIPGQKYGDISVCLSADGRYALSGSHDASLALWEVETGQCLRTFGGHTAPVSSVVVSKDGRLVLSGSGDTTLKLWELSTGRCLRTFAGHKGRVTSVCLSEDERVALSGSADMHQQYTTIVDSTLKLWDVATGECLRTFSGHTGGVSSVSLSRDGRYVLSGGWDKTARLWEAATGECLRTFEGHLKGVSCVSLSRDGCSVLTGSVDGSVKIWELAPGECLRTFEIHADEVTWMCLSEDGRYVLSGSADRTIKLWEIATGKGLRTFEGHLGDVNSVCLSGDERFVVSGSEDRTLKLWSIATGKCLHTFEGHHRGVNAVCVSANGLYGISASDDWSVRQWELATGYSFLAPFAISHLVTSETAAEVEDLLAEARAAQKQGDTAAEVRILRSLQSVPGYEHNSEIRQAWRRLYSKARHISFRTGWLVRTFEGHTKSVTTACLSGDGRMALSGSWDQTVKLWEVETGKCLRTFQGHTMVVRSTCLSEDGRYALSGSEDTKIKLWDVTTGKCLRTFEGNTGGVMSVCFSRDGRLALSGSGEGIYAPQGVLKLWDVKTGRCLRTFEGQTDRLNAVCLGGDERYVLSGGMDGTPKLWKVAIGKPVRKYSGHTGPVNTVCLSEDGRYALSGGAGFTLELWDAVKMKCLRTFIGHQNYVTSACFSMDASYVLSGSSDATLKLWSTETGACLHTFEGHTGCVDSVSMSRDGCYALSGGLDNTLKLWELDWELEENPAAGWDDGAQPYLKNFLTLHTPFAGALPKSSQPTGDELTLALTRRGRPSWNEQDFQQLMFTLGCAGFGSLRSEDVRSEMDKLVQNIEEIPQRTGSAPPAPGKINSPTLEKQPEPKAETGTDLSKKASPPVLPEASDTPGKRSWLSRLFGKKGKAK